MKTRLRNIQTCFNKLSAFDFVELVHMKPTQMLVGMREVADRQKRLRKEMKTPETLKKYLKSRPILVVMGPEDEAYIVDHHHLALALQREGFSIAPVEVLHDYSGLTRAQFQKKMQERRLFYPYDENGRKHDLKDLPQTLDGLRDDPYRSLAWYVRHEGGFKKTRRPFAEFAWARFFNRHIPPEDVAASFEDACAKALALSRDKSASGLPGYVGGKVFAGATVTA
ncbi:MAG: hypothetical protein KGQ70_05725 [Alphaproteobacteria bacterium]|nr:hypothetical protein [Alphaproteobacteria bacterium]